MIEESAAYAVHDAAPVAAEEPAAIEVTQAVVVQERGRLANIALFLAAPFIGLAYALMLPAVGMAMIAGMAVKAIAAKYPGFTKAATLAAAPFIGLVFAITLPVVGVAMLIKVAAQAALAKARTA
jgi:hypothetical protein